MKILFTGQPHSGKTTLLNNLIADISNKEGFVTAEIPDETNPGQRFGFNLVRSDGVEENLAHVDSTSRVRVSKYGVNVEVLDSFVEPLFTFTPDQLLYIDEIGQMELYSQKFKDLVKYYINAQNDFIGTITSVFEDALVTQLKADSRVEIIEITPENRDSLFAQLSNRLGN